jgi:hypothetical protein
MKKSLLTFSILIALPLLLLGQVKTIEVKKTEHHAPVIDGVIDETCWETVDWEDSFTQYLPKNGEKPGQKTSFKILYDNDNIYIAIKAYDTQIEKIERRMTRRDGMEGDRVGVYFDSYLDKRTAFQFIVNAAGVKSDGIMTDDGNNTDFSWDPIWYTKTSIGNDAWYAEMKIPLSQLRFSEKSEQTWGLQIVRNIFRDSETSYWQHIPSDASGMVSKYGELTGLKNLKPKRQIELAPFIAGKYENYPKEEGNPFYPGKEYGYNFGLDGKIGITNNLILDFSINPDFGQVEADPSELNLTAFESYFSEKRPFFIEGNNITDYQITPGGHPWAMDNLFYSRRIGRVPQASPDLSDGEFSKLPVNTKILAALKLTGKTKNGWSLGIIESIGNREYSKITGENGDRKEIAEPYTNYLVSRIQKDMNGGNTIIGAMFTSTNRNLESPNLNFMVTDAYAGGIDFQQFFLKKKYFVSAKYIASSIQGSTDAILRHQESPRRYYQRPDEQYYRLDSSLTRLSGHGGNFMIGKQANSGLRFAFNATWRSPGLELNDVGFLRQANTVFQYFWVGYSITKPFSIFRRVNFNVNQWSGWDFNKINLFSGGNFGFNLVFKNQWYIGAGYNHESNSISNTALWGGPSIKLPGNSNTYIFVGSNSTKKFYVETSFYTNEGKYNSTKSVGMDMSVNYRPMDNLSISLSPNYSLYMDKLQRIDNLTYKNESRYIFGTIDQKAVSITARIDFNITPDLTIQFYGSPFATAGEYSEIKYITNPKADNFSDRFKIYGNELSLSDDSEYEVDENNDGSMDYRFGKPDFNFRQFRSNLVLRWEYTPGSLVYLVWSQGKTDFTTDRFSYMNDMQQLFLQKGRNTFLIKISHRIRAEGIKFKKDLI